MKVRAVYSIANISGGMTFMTATDNKLITPTELEKLEGKKIWNMHFGKSEPYSVVLMSVQDDSPYDDRKLEN